MINFSEFDIEEQSLYRYPVVPFYLRDISVRDVESIFKIGDILMVNCILDVPLTGQKVEVVGVTGSMVSLDFYNYIGGHSCGGKTTRGHCWRFSPYNDYNLKITKVIK